MVLRVLRVTIWREIKSARSNSEVFDENFLFCTSRPPYPPFTDRASSAESTQQSRHHVQERCVYFLVLMSAITSPARSVTRRFRTTASVKDAGFVMASMALRRAGDGAPAIYAGARIVLTPLDAINANGTDVGRIRPRLRDGRGSRWNASHRASQPSRFRSGFSVAPTAIETRRTTPPHGPSHSPDTPTFVSRYAQWWDPTQETCDGPEASSNAPYATDARHHGL